MPTYDYRCDGCCHEFEHFQSMSSALLKSCPKCRKPRLKRLIGGGGGLLFKGSGFYITDYRSPAYQEAAKQDSAKQDSAKSDKSDAPAAKTGSGEGSTAGKAKDAPGGKSGNGTTPPAKPATPATPAPKGNSTSGSRSKRR